MSEEDRQAAIQRSRQRAQLVKAARRRHEALPQVTKDRLERDYSRAKAEAVAIVRNSNGVYA